MQANRRVIGGMVMKRVFAFIISIMIINSCFYQISFAEDDLIIETGTVSVSGAEDAVTKAQYWMTDTREAAEVAASRYFAENTASLRAVDGQFIGYQCSNGTSGVSTTISDPDGAYLTSISFYAYYRGTNQFEDFEIYAADSLDGDYEQVQYQSKEKIDGVNGQDVYTHPIYRYDIVDI